MKKLLILLVTFVGLPVLSAAEVDKPNVIFIMADDMGIDWVSCYGASHKTPHLDRMAQNGMRFQTAWCNPICTPTRMTLLTGQYPFRNGWINHHDVPRWGGKGFDWDRFVCWARPVRDAGYATGIGGKWQINDFRKHPDALKLHGFDEHCMWTGYETGNAPPSNERYWNPYLVTNGKRKVHKGQFGPTVINDFACDFIKSHKTKPFFFYYPMLLPHGPQVLTPLNKDNPPQGKGKRYPGMVTYIDELVGRLIKTVDEAGLREKTIIIFTCDNGSPAAGKVNGKAYQKGKGRVANRGAHVPFIVRAPFLTGKKVGWVSQDLMDFTDLYPTFLSLTGAKRPAGTKLDGRSIVGLINGKAKPSEKRQWIYAQRGKGRMVRNHRYLLDNEGGFYDVIADPLQKTNLAASDKPEMVKARNHLQKVLADMPENAPVPFKKYGTRSRSR